MERADAFWAATADDLEDRVGRFIDRWQAEVIYLARHRQALADHEHPRCLWAEVERWAGPIGAPCWNAALERKAMFGGLGYIPVWGSSSAQVRAVAGAVILEATRSDAGDPFVAVLPRLAAIQAVRS